MHRLFLLAVLLVVPGLFLFSPGQEKSVRGGKVIASGLGQPGPICVAENGDIFVGSSKGIQRLRGSGSEPVGLADRKIQHVAALKNILFACDHEALWRIEPSGAPKIIVRKEQFAALVKEPITLASFTIDEKGLIYVVANHSDGRGCIFKVVPSGKVGLEFAPGTLSDLRNLSAVCPAGETAIMIQRSNDPEALLLCLLTHRVIAKVPFCAGSALEYDSFGRLYGTDGKAQQVSVLARPGDSVTTIPQTFKTLGGLTVDHAQHRLLATDTQDGTVVSLPLGDPAHPIDELPLPLTVEPAFPKIKWAGWEPVNEKGISVPHRPIILTHAGDQSNRTFVATQHGVIHVFPHSLDVTQTKIFLNLQEKVSYNDNQNEEGFLGLTFHPKYKENGEFFVFYSPKTPKLTTVISRFKVSKDDPDRADPKSEEVLMTFKRPFWNHDGGTLCFGPDGYLYIGLGDGGAANDPYDHGQNLNTILGSMLRIDVDTRASGKPYGIPKDNPFVNREKACPEIYAYGIRNIWRMAFDRQTGQCWFGEVGQNLYEEINLLHKGGNYGWNRRESFHPFGKNAVDANKEMIEPIWEYHHRVGKSITGGHVYRGKQFPELQGLYLYADYVSAKIWALNYDFAQKRVTAHREIKHRNMPIMSFGEDHEGETYLLTFSASGQGIDRIVRKK